MRSTLLLTFLFSQLAFSAQNIHQHSDPYEVRFIRAQELVIDAIVQAELLQEEAWSTFSASHPDWRVVFDERSALPKRAFGPGIPTTASSVEGRAIEFMTSALTPFSLPMDELELRSSRTNAKHHILFFSQRHDDMEVLNSSLMVKMTLDGRVISWKADVHPTIEFSDESSISEAAAMASASGGLDDIAATSVDEELFILPIPTTEGYDHRRIYRCTVSGTSEVGVPYRYLCLVDAVTGELHYRSNEIHSYDNCGHGHETTSACPEPPMTVGVQLTADTWVTDPSDAMEERPLGGIRIDIDGTEFQTDEEGAVNAAIDGPVPAVIRFQGDYANVLFNGVTPSYSATLQEGENELSANGEVDQGAISGFLNANVIHDYMKSVLPDHLGMDFALPVNVGISPHECNAYYDGSSINFFVGANNCVSLVNVADVVFHEYGHGINRTYYQSFGADYDNGAMNEGYADVWAFAENEDPVLGNGLNPQDAFDFVRRYDVDPKVYPQDLIGQVHADGEIIAGAWWDTYLALDSDMDYTMELFSLAYDGLQATALNGFEGQAYTDVLLDALEADDDDGDLSNGSPNGDGIIAAFDIHGITLLSAIGLDHDVTPYLSMGEDAQFLVEADITGLYNTSLEGVSMHYRTSPTEAYEEVAMTALGDDLYEAVLSSLENGTIVDYYLTATATGGDLAGVLPSRVLEEDPVLPYYSLVGYVVAAEDDRDDNISFTDWEFGISSDEATTGEWESDNPVATFIDGSVVAPGDQTTPGGSDCFITGNANFSDEGAGTNDIDAGTTTLLSDVIDLSIYEDPVLEYQRWYTNNTGANPNADWWQVQISDDGGENWVYVENTMVSETEWRRYMFRISDHVELTDMFMIKYNASDSLRPGQPQNGGSLVEAAVDDIRLHDSSLPDGLEEVDFDHPLHVYPNPTTDRLILTADAQRPLEGSIRIFDAQGRSVYRSRVTDRQQMEIDVSSLANGVYSLKLVTNGRSAAAAEFVKE